MNKYFLKNITLLKNKIQRSIILQNPKYKKYVGFSKFGILGGLGNQLFQISNVLAYCMQYNYKPFFIYSKEFLEGHR